MSDEALTCSGCGEYAGSHISARIEALTAKVKLMDDLDAINGEKIEVLEAKLELAKKGLRKIIRTSDMHSAWDIAIATVEKLE